VFSYFLTISFFVLSLSNCSLIYSYHNSNEQKRGFKVWFLGYQTFSGYYIARITALLGNLNECSYWFSRAKLDSNIPPLEILSKNPEFNSVVNNIVSSIINESVYYTNERIRFHNDCLKIEKHMSSLSSNLSESTVMRTALSRSTFNILIESNSPLHDFIAFWKPVTGTLLAKKDFKID